MPFRRPTRQVALLLASIASIVLVATRSLAEFDFQQFQMQHTPTSMTASEDGKLVFVAHEGSDAVSVIDAASGKVQVTISTKQPSAILARGSQLLVANQDAGTISVFSADKKWEKTDEVETGFKKCQAISAPLGSFYKGVLIATCKEHESVGTVVVVDIKKDKHYVIGGKKVGMGVTTVGGDGKRYFVQDFPWGGGSIREIRDFAAAVAGKEGDTPPFSHEYRWLLYQVRPGNFWFGNREIHTGMPPLPAGPALGYMLVPDRVENVCYGLTEDKVVCYAVDLNAPKIGEQPAKYPKAYGRFARREGRDGKAAQFNKSETDEYGSTDRYQVGMTLDKKLHFYLFSQKNNTLYHATGDAFDLTKAPQPTVVADNSAGALPEGGDAMPAKVRVGQQVKIKLSGAAGSSWELVTAPTGAKIAADGELTWTPTKAQAGAQQFKIKVKSGEQVNFERLKTEVVDLTDLAKAPGSTSKTPARPVKPPVASTGSRTKPSTDKSDEDIDLDTVGVYQLNEAKLGLSYSLDRKSLLAACGRELRIIDASGLQVTQSHEFENRYQQIVERPEYYVGLAAKSIDLIDKKTFATKRSIEIDYSQLVSMAVDPTRKITYVAVAKPSVKNIFGSKPVLEVNESTGETRVLPDVSGQTLQMGPQGKRLFTSLHEIFKDGMTWDAMGVRERFGNIDIVTSYDVSGPEPKKLGRNEAPGENGKHFEIATDGLHVAYVAGGGAGGGGDTRYSIAALAADDVSRETSRYKIEHYPVDIAFHPTLNIVACANQEHIWLFNRKTGEPEPERLDSTTKYKDIERLFFAPGGARLMVVYRHPGRGAVLQAIPIKLSEQEQKTASAAAPSAPPAEAASKSRNWSDKTGEHRIEAELVGVENGMAVLKRSAGGTIRVALDQLSDEDQAYIKKLKR